MRGFVDSLCAGLTGDTDVQNIIGNWRTKD